MKPRRRHLTTVSSYAFWLQPAKPPQWEWFCCCGAQQSGYPDEGDAELGAYDHEQSFELVDAGVAVAILGISSAGWLAFGIVAVVVVAALVMLARACRNAITIEPPEWTIRSQQGVFDVKPDPAELWGRLDPAELWGLLSSDTIPPDEGSTMSVPGHTWVFSDGVWRHV